MTTVPQARRILVLTYSHTRVGGIEAWVDLLCRGLHEHGWGVVLASAWGHQHNDPTWRERVPAPFERIRLDARTGTAAARVLAVSDALVAMNPAVALCVGLGDVHAGAAHARARGWRGALALAVHGANEALFEDCRAQSSSLEGIGCVNAAHARVLRRRIGEGATAVAFLPNGTARVDGGLAQRREPGPGGLHVLYVGRIHQASKRVLDLPAILSAVRERGVEATLTIVGAGPDLEALQHAIASSGAGGHLALRGELPPAQVREEYARHDVILLCSQTEAAPLALLEGMAHGLAPVTSAFAGWRGTGLAALLEGWTFRVGDIDGAAHLLERLACDRTLLLDRQGAAVREADERADDACVARWCGFLARLAAAPRRVCGPAQPRLEGVPAAGRLDRVLAPRGAERVRRLLRRRPCLPDGWAEWPGTVAGADVRLARELEADLHADDSTLVSTAPEPACTHGVRPTLPTPGPTAEPPAGPIAGPFQESS